MFINLIYLGTDIEQLFLILKYIYVHILFILPNFDIVFLKYYKSIEFIQNENNRTCYNVTHLKCIQKILLLLYFYSTIL